MKLLPLILLTASITIYSQENTADVTHRLISYQITSFATTIDKFFADDSRLNYQNNTRLRIFTDTTFNEGQNQVTEGNFKFQLQLPGLQKRLQLIIEREDISDDDENVAQTNLNNNRDDDTKAGLQYLLSTSGIKTSVGTGIIFREITPKPFTRFRARKNITFSKWLFKPEQEILWVNDEGFTTFTELDFDKKLSSTLLLRFVNNIRWDDNDYIIDFENGPSLFQKVSDKIGLSYNARVISSDTPSMAINNYSFSVGYRQLLYKKWFFWTISPALNFPRELKFKRTPSIVVRFESIFGKI